MQEIIRPIDFDFLEEMGLKCPSFGRNIDNAYIYSYLYCEFVNVNIWTGATQLD